MAKVTVYTEKAQTREIYQVVRVKNGTTPVVGTRLTREDVDQMVKDGIEVIVDLPRKRD